WLLTSSGGFTDTQTIGIAGVTFTTVTSIGSTPGNVLIGASAAETLTNLTAAINNPTVTSSTQVALSAANANLITNIKGLSATTTATVMTLVSSNHASVTVSETQTNAAWSFVSTSAG